MTKLIEGMRYLEWQKRNKEGFEHLSKSQKKEARSRGYYNVGWEKVLHSWKIICQINNIVTLFEYKLSKGDILGAIGQSIAEAAQAKVLAQQAIEAFEQTDKFLEELVSTTLAKYPLL